MVYQFVEFVFHGTFPKIYETPSLLAQNTRKKSLTEEGKTTKETITRSDLLLFNVQYSKEEKIIRFPG